MPCCSAGHMPCVGRTMLRFVGVAISCRVAFVPWGQGAVIQTRNIKLITIFISVLKQEPEERHAPEILCITWCMERLQTVLNNTLVREPCLWVEVGQSLWQQFLILNWLQITDWMIFTILYFIYELTNIHHKHFIARALCTSVSWYHWSELQH